MIRQMKSGELMAANKYSRDYRLIEEFIEKGRVRTDYEYIGDYWSFEKDEKTVAEEKRRAFLCVLFAGAAFVMSLLPYSGMMHRLYIALPFVFTALPLFMTADLVTALQRYKEPMEHRFADKLNNSYPARTLAMLYLSAAALIGEFVYILTSGVKAPGDAVMAICTAVLVICSFLLFRKRTVFKAVVTEKREAVK